MAPSLLLLPSELIGRIVSCMQNRVDLASLSLTCSLFYEFATPLLYRNVDLQDASEYGQARVEDSHFPALRGLTVVLLSRPRLASYVWTFTLRDDWNGDSDISSIDSERSRSKRNRYITAADLKEAAATVPEPELRTAVHDSSLNNVEEFTWLHALDSPDSDDALIALLLPCLSNLKVLDLMIPFSCSFYWRMMRRASRNEKPFDSRPPFPALHSIMNTWSENKYGMDAEVIAPYFDLPAITSLYMFRLGESVAGPLDNLEPRSSTVTHLELKQCNIPSPSLIKMLNVPADLKTFIYEIGFGHLSYARISIPELGEGLRPTHSSLENIWLGYEDQDGTGGIDWVGDDWTPISLERFRCLRHVRCSMIFLYDRVREEDDSYEATPNSQDFNTLVQRLPASVETLHLDHSQGYEDLLLVSLQRLLEMKNDTIFPSLTAVIIEIAFNGDKSSHNTTRVESLAREKKIKLKMLDTGKEQIIGSVERGWGMDEDIFFAPGTTAMNECPIFVEVEEHPLSKEDAARVKKEKQELLIYQEAGRGYKEDEDREGEDRNWRGMTRAWPRRRRLV